MLEIWHFFDTKFWFVSNMLISTFCSKNRYQWAKGLSCCMSCLCSCLFCQVSPGLKFMQVFWRSSTSKNQHVFHFVWIIIIIIVYFDNAKHIDVEVITLTAFFGTHVWLQARAPNLNQLSIWNWDRAFWGKFGKERRHGKLSHQVAFNCRWLLLYLWANWKSVFVEWVNDYRMLAFDTSCTKETVGVAFDIFSPASLLLCMS